MYYILGTNTPVEKKLARLLISFRNYGQLDVSWRSVEHAKSRNLLHDRSMEKLNRNPGMGKTEKKLNLGFF